MNELLNKIKLHIELIKSKRQAYLEQNLDDYECQRLVPAAVLDLNFSSFTNYIFDLYKKRLGLYKKISHGGEMVFLLPLPVNHFNMLCAGIYYAYVNACDIFKIRTVREMEKLVGNGIFHNLRRAIESLNTGNKICANYGFPREEEKNIVSRDARRDTNSKLNTYKINPNIKKAIDINTGGEKFALYSEINYRILSKKEKIKYIQFFSEYELNQCVKINFLTVECINKICKNCAETTHYA